jgi:hypothetical protein
MMKARDMFRAWGMTDGKIEAVLPCLQEEDVDDLDMDTYLSDIDEDDDDGFEADELDEYDEYVDSLSDEEIDDLFEGFGRISTPKTVRRAKGKERRKWLKTAGGRKYMQHQNQARRTTGYKIKQKKHQKKVKARGGTKKGYIFRESLRGGPEMGKSLLENVMEIAEAIDRDPEARFEEFATAFNRIADLGELAAMRLMEEEDGEDAALDVLDLSLAAENVLKNMEEMDGTLSDEEDRELEETLADAMDSVGEYMSRYGLLDEDSDLGEDSDEDDDLDDDDDDLSEAFHATASELREARPSKSAGRFLLNPSKRKKVKGRSKYAKAGMTSKTKAMVQARGDVRNKEALLGYLKMVKAGKLAPGQPILTSKSGKKLNKGARAAMKRGASKR